MEELGVREKPPLPMLLDRIAVEHEHSSKDTVDGYQLPKALVFLAKHFQTYYVKFWRVEDNQRAFLPCSSPKQLFQPADGTDAGQTTLHPPQGIFAGV